jgi:hypothetical protein
MVGLQGQEKRVSPARVASKRKNRKFSQRCVLELHSGETRFMFTEKSIKFPEMAQASTVILCAANVHSDFAETGM